MPHLAALQAPFVVSHHTDSATYVATCFKDTTLRDRVRTSVRRYRAEGMRDLHGILERLLDDIPDLNFDDYDNMHMASQAIEVIFGADFDFPECNSESSAESVAY
jgi:hypothetical protein